MHRDCATKSNIGRKFLLGLAHHTKDFHLQPIADLWHFGLGHRFLDTPIDVHEAGLVPHQPPTRISRNFLNDQGHDVSNFRVHVGLHANLDYPTGGSHNTSNEVLL